MERLTPIKAIRAYCILCCGGSSHGPRKCVNDKCPLWPYRIGKHPTFNKSSYRREDLEKRGTRLADMRARLAYARLKLKEMREAEQKQS